MLSGRLIRLIEGHEEQIATSVIREIRRYPELTDLGKVSDAELRERYRQILGNLGYWLEEGQKAEIVRDYELIGKSRYERGIPLHQSVRALAIAKDKTIDFTRYQGFARNAVDLYAEEELERSLWRFFDELTVHMVRGYETAWCRAAHTTA